MKTNEAVAKAFLLAFALLFSGCECAEELTELPPETQTGANNLGCLIDGELFVNQRNLLNWLNASVYAEYNYGSNTEKLSIRASSKDGGHLFLIDSVLKVNQVHKLDCAYFSAINNKKYIMQNSEGEINLTKFDLVNLIVSGTFSFRAKDSGNADYHIPGSDTVINITQGRFDVHFSKYPIHEDNN